MDRDRRVLLSWAALLTAIIVVFGSVDGGALATPSLTDPGAWPDWLATTAPATTAFALLRLLVVALAWYLLGATALGVLARLTRARHLTRIADAVTLPSLRHLLQAAVGLGLAASAVGIVTTPPPVAHAVQASSGDEFGFRPPVLDTPLWDPVPETATVVVPPTTDRASLATPPALDPSAFVEAPPVPVDPRQRSAPSATATEEPAADEGVASPATAGDPETWVVQRGEHFWSIAEARVAAVSPDPPREHEIAEYWHRLIAANRGVLAVPDEPDLLFPGQVLSLPPLEA
ncbi:MAG: hypothetical protein KY469_18705 [Actinobacteria bacterium]|nr:hypothetical protein [Actinomycetota bacterium]